MRTTAVNRVMHLMGRTNRVNRNEPNEIFKSKLNIAKFGWH